MLDLLKIASFDCEILEVSGELFPVDVSGIDALCLMNEVDGLLKLVDIATCSSSSLITSAEPNFYQSWAAFSSPDSSTI